MTVSEWVTVAQTADVREGEMLGTTVAGVEVLVANVGGEYRSIGSECTHAGCFLHEDGELDEDQAVVTCQCDGSVFDLETGEAVGPPASVGVPVYKVRVEGDEIQVAAPGV
jgi:nitrite reductase/ring-hydroxylating ferredoxin subunit